MKESLKGPKVEGVHFLAIPEKTELGGTQYYIYLLSLRTDIMEGIIINSKGYGKHPVTNEEIKTSTLRHSLEVMLPQECAKIEPIMDDVFGLANEYWLSFWADDIMYDKKFVFEPNFIQEKNFVEIPFLGKMGVLI